MTEEPGTTQSAFKIPYHIVLIFLVLSIGMVISGYLYYQNLKKNILVTKQDELSAIVDLKVSQIENWRKERLGDAMTIYENQLLMPHAREFLTMETSANKQIILKWMQSLQKYYQYKSIILLDSDEGSLAFPNEKFSVLIRKGWRRNQSVQVRSFFRIYWSKTVNAIRLTLAVPLSITYNRKAVPVGVILMRIDPYRFLYPLIQSRPTPSKTAETVLFRREGDEVVFLNELRHKKDTALKLRFSINEPKLPSAMAIRGIRGVVEGIDYRGIPVLAIVKPVPDSSSYLKVTTKIDKSEIYAPVHERLWIVVTFMIILIAGSAAGVGFIWRHQQADCREKYEMGTALAEERRRAGENLSREKSFSDSTINSLPGIFYLFDEKGHFLRWNRNFENVSGYSPEEMDQLHPLDFFSGDEKKLVEGAIQEVFAKGASDIEADFVSKDGRRTPYYFTGVRFLWDNRPYIVGTGIDISVRRRAEEALRMSEERFRILFENAPLGTGVATLEGQLLAYNEALMEITGYTKEELLNFNVRNLYLNLEDRKPLLQKLQNNGHARNYEVLLQRKDGSSFYANLTINIIAFDGKKAVLTLFEDITSASERRMKFTD